MVAAWRSGNIVDRTDNGPIANGRPKIKFNESIKIYVSYNVISAIALKRLPEKHYAH